MFVTTNFPCGNGQIHWIHRDHFEVEVIGYSKAPRYTTFKIGGVNEPRRQKVILRPDQRMEQGFEPFQTLIWLSRDGGDNWKAIPKHEVEITANAIRFAVDLRPGEDLLVSTEPPRPYADTIRELFALQQENPEIARVHLIGCSIEQRPIFVLRVGEGPSDLGPVWNGEKPVSLFIAGEHATEWAGEEITRGMLRAFLRKDDRGTALRRAGIFDFILVPNPDGNVNGWHQYNAKDWAEHNYAQVVDRSWHHEFQAYFTGDRSSLSPETIAVGQWVDLTRPQFVHNAHSWYGHQGNPGAFRSDPSTMDPQTGEFILSLDRICEKVAARFGVRFEAYPTTSLCSGHLIDYLVSERKVPGYSIEGHPAMSRADLQQFGEEVILEMGSEGLLSGSGAGRSLTAAGVC